MPQGVLGQLIVNNCSIFFYTFGNRRAASRSQLKTRGAWQRPPYMRNLEKIICPLWHSSSSPSNLLPVYRSWLPKALKNFSDCLLPSFLIILLYFVIFCAILTNYSSTPQTLPGIRGAQILLLLRVYTSTHLSTPTIPSAVQCWHWDRARCRSACLAVTSTWWS